MKIVSVVFGNTFFRHMINVLEYSASLYCPNAEFIKIEAEPHTHVKGVPTFVSVNLHKHLFWADIVSENPDEEIVLMDADTAIFGDLSKAFEHEFDLAYTYRDYKIPFNSGVLYVRSTETVRRFFDKWTTIQNQFLRVENRVELNNQVAKYAGLCQATFKHMLEYHDMPIDLVELPCEIFNSCDQNWADFSKDTLVLHIKGRLRRAVMEKRNPKKCALFSNALRAYQDLESLAQTHLDKETEHVATN